MTRIDKLALGRRELGRQALGAMAFAGLALRPGLGHAAGGTGTVVAAIDNDPPTLNPGISTDYATGEIAAKIYESLVWLDIESTPQPSLATSWDAAPDGRTYSFKLRQGVTWHDGKPFTAADVKFTFEEVLGKLHPRMAAVLKSLGAVIETPDDHTAVFRLQRGYAPFLVQMTVFDAPILPKHLFEGTNIPAAPASQAPVGTGPFKFQEWNRGANIRLTRNENYWDKPKPYLAEVVFQIVPQAANRSAGLQTGELDVVSDFYMPKPDLPRLMRDASLQNRQGINIPAIWFAMFNTTSPVFAQKEARQAVAMAVDRPRLVKQVMNGIARPGVRRLRRRLQVAAERGCQLREEVPLRCRQGQGAAGKGRHQAQHGRRCACPSTWRGPQMRGQAQIIQENLRAIGLEVSLQPLERSVYATTASSPSANST
jgi:peptide/nickel transport system substrate-binding protein